MPHSGKTAFMAMDTEFHIIFSCHIIFKKIFFKHLNVKKRIVSLWTVRKPAEAWVWPAGDSVPHPAVDAYSFIMPRQVGIVIITPMLQVSEAK